MNIARLTKFIRKHPKAKRQLESWISLVENAEWKTPADVNRVNRRVGILNGKRAIFNINGNDYRLIAAFNFEKGIATVRFIGTHKEYDRINAEAI